MTQILKRSLFAILLFVVTPVFTFAQTLTGTYTIGGSNPDFTDFNSAIAALDSNGVAGAITFMVRDGNYNEQLVFHAINGASVADTVTFQSASHDSSQVVLEWSSDSLHSNVKLDSVAHLRFRGITFHNSSTHNAYRLIGSDNWVSDLKISHCAFTSAVVDTNENPIDLECVDSCSYIEITHCFFQKGINNVFIVYGNHLKVSQNYFKKGGTAVFINSSFNVMCNQNNFLKVDVAFLNQWGKNVIFNDNNADTVNYYLCMFAGLSGPIEINRNKLNFSNASGIYIFNNYPNPINRIEISENNLVTLSDAIFVEDVYCPLKISNNEIKCSGFNTFGIGLYGVSDSMLVINNKVTTTDGGIPIYTNYVRANNANTCIIANNMTVGGLGNNTFGEGSLYFKNSKNITIAFNSISGLDTSGAELISMINDSNLIFKNNIFQYSGNTTNTSNLINADAASTYQMDYNDYYYDTTSAIIGLSNQAIDLAAQQNVLNMDQHSMVMDPRFFNDTTDLRICNGQLYQAGTPTVGITGDYFGTNRNSTMPTIGAEELDSALPKPTAAFSYSIDSLSNGKYQFTFSNNSKGANSWYWDFGDGSYSNAKNPVHVFNAALNYKVKLIAYSPCNEDFTSQVMHYTDVQELTLKVFNFYPNPVKDHFTIEWQEPIKNGKLYILNTTGKVKREYILPQDQSLRQFTINLENLCKGLYLVEIQNENLTVVQKFIKE